jgi:hypothetical protein
MQLHQEVYAKIMHGYTKEGLDDFIHFQGVIVHLQKVHYEIFFKPNNIF